MPPRVVDDSKSQKGKTPAVKIDWRRRLITAAVAIPSLIAAVSLPEPVFSATVILAISIAYREVSNLVNYELKINYLLFVLMYWFSMHPLLLFLASAVNLFVPLFSQGPADGIRNGLFHLFYYQMFAIPVMYGSLLRNLPVHGWTMTLVWILVSFASDAGALTMGSQFGTHLCCPSISPKKTWEGIAGALIGGIAASLGLYQLGIDATGEIGLIDFVMFGLIESVFGMLGDLVESGFKRFVSAKDASGLLPGHGGYLDRLDALGAAVPVLFYYCKFRGW